MPRKSIQHDLPNGFTTQRGEIVADTDAMKYGFAGREMSAAERDRLHRENESAACKFVVEVVRDDWRIISNHRFLQSRVDSDGNGPWWASARRCESAAACLRFKELGTRTRLVKLLNQKAIFVADLIAFKQRARKWLPPDYLAQIDEAIEEFRGNREAFLPETPAKALTGVRPFDTAQLEGFRAQLDAALAGKR